MRIGYVRLFVTDLAAAKKFYAQILGLEILWEYENKAIGFDLGPVLIVEDVSSEEDLNERHLDHHGPDHSRGNPSQWGGVWADVLQVSIRRDRLERQNIALWR